MDSSPVNEPAPPIRRLGDYELLEEIARGGMGIVYRARQVSLNRIVALKMIRDSQLATPNAVKRFRIEAEAAARLEHPNLVPLFEFGELEGFQFLSMRFIEGSSLTKELHGRPMDARPAAELIAKIARAIHYAHQRGILHRDLKPANILLDAQGQPHVTDFGLAKFTEQESGLTLSSDVLGSPNYMAPEQAAGNGQQLTTAADVYSLGAILYEMLTGRAPFLAAAPLETMRKVVEEEPIPPHALYSFVDEDLETICLKCMEKEPARRYGAALELAQDLERWVAGEPIHARPVGIFERVGKWMRRNPKITALLVLLHLVFVAGLVGILITSVRLASANREKEGANVRLAKNVRDFEWQKIDELIKTGKRAEALAYLSAFLREDPHDHVAATRLISMMSSCSFALPAMTPLQHGAAVNMLDLSSDGQRLLTAADDGKVRIWALSDGRVLTTLVHPVKVSFASFVAGEELVLTTCQDGSSRLWDVKQEKILFEFPQGLAAQNGIMSAERRKFALREADASMQLWDLRTQQRIGSPLQVPATVRWAAFSPDVEHIALASADGTVSVWKLANAAQLASLKLPDDVTRVEFSPDSKTLAVAWGGSITFWDVSRQVKLRELKSHDGQVLQIEFSPDGKQLVSMAYDRPLVIWDVASGKSIGQPIDAERPFAYFCLSPDGKRLLTRAQSGVARVWSALTGLPLSEPFEHEGPVTFVKFSPDGRRVLTASQDGTARVWQPQAAQRQALDIKTTDVYPAACFSKDGQRVFWTTRNRVEIYDTLSGQQVGKPMPHSAQVYRIKLSPDGKKLATAA